MWWLCDQGTPLGGLFFIVGGGFKSRYPKIGGAKFSDGELGICKLPQDPLGSLQNFPENSLQLPKKNSLQLPKKNPENSLTLGRRPTRVPDEKNPTSHVLLIITLSNWELPERFQISKKKEKKKRKYQREKEKKKKCPFLVFSSGCVVEVVQEEAFWRLFSNL